MSLGGADGSKFDINQANGNGGQLTFKKQPNYEKPTDADMDNVYEVTVQATDGKLTGMLKVKVTVTNEEEAGTVSLDKVAPVVGIPVTATLKDADGGISKLTWQWSIGSGANTGGVDGVTATSDVVEVATSDTYTPKAGDVGGALTATAIVLRRAKHSQTTSLVTPMRGQLLTSTPPMLRGTPGTRRRCSKTRTLTRAACRTARRPGRWRRAPRTPLVLRLWPLTPRLPGHRRRYSTV